MRLETAEKRCMRCINAVMRFGGGGLSLKRAASAQGCQRPASSMYPQARPLYVKNLAKNLSVKAVGDLGVEVARRTTDRRA